MKIRLLYCVVALLWLFCRIIYSSFFVTILVVNLHLLKIVNLFLPRDPSKILVQFDIFLALVFLKLKKIEKKQKTN